MSARRWFLRETGSAIGSNLIAPLLSAEATRARLVARQSGCLRAVQAGTVAVSLGIALPVNIPGVHIQFLRLRMPVGIHLAATLFLPEGSSSINRVRSILEILPYRKEDDPARPRSRVQKTC